MSESKLNEYLSLINMSYTEAVDYLLKKHGPVKDDFFREKSYERFLNGKIKTITHGNYTKTSEGLITHHIAENKFENLSNSTYIKTFQYPFDLQRQSVLVYVDLIEHLILHALIAKETNCRLGYKGYDIFIKPNVQKWYITGKTPQLAWKKAVYKRAFLTESEVDTLFQAIDSGPLIKAEACQKQLNKMIAASSLHVPLDTLTLDEWYQYRSRYDELLATVLSSKPKLTNAQLKTKIESFLANYLLFIR